MSESDLSYPYVPPELVMDNYERYLEGDYTKIWGHTLGVYYHRGLWSMSVVMGQARDLMAEVVSAACLGASLNADQCVWYSPAIESDVPEFEADRYMVMLYVDKWGTRRMRKRSIAIYDDGSIHGVSAWEDGSTEGRFLDILEMAWQLTPGDPKAIGRLLRSRGHKVQTLSGV